VTVLKVDGLEVEKKGLVGCLNKFELEDETFAKGLVGSLNNFTLVF
jgi:hypothetical protein